MRIFSAIILLTVLLSSCKEEECKLSFSQSFNSSVLTLWEQQTYNNLNQRKDPKLLSLFASPKKNSASIFLRKDFFRDVLALKKLQNYRFDSLVVIEITNTGEDNLLVKLLLAYRKQKVEVIKFHHSINTWKPVRNYEEKKDVVDKLVKQLSSPDSMPYYWGLYVTDVLAISKFRGIKDYAVSVYGSLSEPRFKALIQLKRTNLETGI